MNFTMHMIHETYEEGEQMSVRQGGVDGAATAPPPRDKAVPRPMQGARQRPEKRQPASGMREGAVAMARDVADGPPPVGTFQARIHENEIPVFVEAEMERLYGSLYSCLKQFRIYDGVFTGVHTYVAREGGNIRHILLFRLRDGRVKVLNEVIRLSATDIDRFAHCVFGHFREAQLISFKSIQNDLAAPTQNRRLSWTCQRHNCLEDIVLSLPESAAAYHAQLGKNTRRNLKRYGEKLRAAHPSFTFEVFEGDAAREEDLRAIIALNHARMEGKNKQSDIDHSETDRLIALTRQCGLIGVCRIDGKVCAGAMSFRAGDNYFLNVLAHDPAYDEFWLGILCCYMTICECIARGGKEFHFLWGRYDYKFTLLAAIRDLDRIVVYRSRAGMLTNADVWCRAAMEGLSRRTNLQLHDLKRRNTPASRFALRLLDRYRAVKRLATGRGTAAPELHPDRH